MVRHFVTAATMAATLSIAAAAAAQPAAPTLPQPLVVEKIHNGWLFAPDVRAADLDTNTGALAGGYIGRIHDNTWVFGGGAYVLANQDDDFSMWYVGPVVEWMTRADRRIGFGVRSLLGFGSATLPLPVDEVIDPRVLAASSHRSRSTRTSDLRTFPAGATIGVRDDFLLAEPQVNVLLNLSRGQRIVFGLGYRLTANAPWLGDALNGVSGSVAFQIGGGR
jgi:hypothetical protein